MLVAVTYDQTNEEVFQHFGRTENFKVYDLKEGQIESSKVVSTDGRGHGALAGVLKEIGADVLICGGIGGGAQAALNAAGIKFYGGVTGKCDDAAAAFAKNELKYQEVVVCNHHHEGEGHHEGGCGHHEGGCGHHHEGGCGHDHH